MSTEFKWTDELITEFFTKWISDDLRIPEQMQKFKESKQPKPDWEVLSYRHKQTNEITPKESTAFHKAMFNNEHEIYSVKRLVDGEVFSIGDKYRNDIGMKEYTIRAFEIRDGILRANAKEHGFDYFEDLIKVKELFTTEDGVGITKDYPNGISIVYNDFTANYDWPAKDIISQLDYYKNAKYFSTKAAADEYIINNKPCLSMSEVWNYYARSPFEHSFRKHLKELTQSKFKS